MNHNRQTAMVRIAFILSFLGLSVGDSFNVLYSRQLAERLPDMKTPDLFISVPVTAMAAMMVIGVFFSGYIARKSGKYDNYLRLTLMMALIGMLLRGFAFNYVMMLIGVMIDGFAYGCLFIGVRYYAYLFEEKERLSSLAFVNGGAFAGTCMGTILGGMLAGELPYRDVYIFAAVVLLIPLIFLNRIKVDKQVKAGNPLDILKVFKNPNAVIYLLFIVLPLFACSVFMSYSVPLDVDKFGYSETVISALMLTEYLLSAYLGPFMTRFIGKRLKPATATIIFCLMYAIPIGVYAMFKSMPMLIIVMVILGIADSFGLNIVVEAFIKTRKDDSYDDNTALITFIMFTRLGIVVAPMMIMFFGNVIILSVALIVGLSLFIIGGSILYYIAERKGKGA